MSELHKLIMIAGAGAAGTLSRYWLSRLVSGIMGGEFPWGTFAVNMLGSFLFGLVWALAEGRGLFSPEARTIILTGFMGAFTTFSTFAFETGELLRAGQWGLVAANIGAQILIGVGAVFLGIALGRGA